MDQALKQNNDVVSLNDLSADHVDPLKSTVERILATPVARQTFAQIIDGLPLYEERREYPPPATHPLVDGRRDVCPEAYQALDTFRDNFSFDMLHFDTKKAQAYQNTAVDSDNFTKHLLEMTALALHNIGADLFLRADGGLHQHKQEPGPYCQSASLFYHERYQEWTQYPQGAADCAGYWAEVKILGGVVVFNRGESNLEYGRVYLHPFPRALLFSLMPFQLAAFVDFGTNPQREGHPPLPMKPKLGADRVENFDSLDRHIFRDQYERLPRPQDYRFSCYTRSLDDDLEFLAELREAMNSGLLPSAPKSSDLFAPLDDEDGAPPRQL